jgi:hypothetical protein
MVGESFLPKYLLNVYTFLKEVLMGIFKSRKQANPWRQATPETPFPRPADGRIESAIVRALREGQLENLPGQGQPLDDTDLTSGSEFLMQKILKDQGFAPEWARLLQAVEQVEDAQAALKEAGSDDDVRRLRETLAHFRNDLVRTLNQRVPSPALQKGLRDPSRDV